MTLIPVLLKGTAENDLFYDFGAAYAIEKGTWQVAIQTVAFDYYQIPASAPHQDPPEMPSINSLVYISCNYVEDLVVQDSSTVTTEESIIALQLLALKAGFIKSFKFQSRDFFDVAAPSTRFYLRMRKEDGTPLLEEAYRPYLTISALLLFRRVR